MNFRYANENDFNFIQENDIHLAQGLISMKIKNREIIIIDEEGLNIGWLRFGYFWDNIPFMNMLWIKDEYRSKGIGKEITLFWENEMKNLKFKTAMTSTLSNEDAQHFYRKLGYKDVGELLLENEPLEILLIKNLS